MQTPVHHRDARHTFMENFFLNRFTEISDRITESDSSDAGKTHMTQGSAPDMYGRLKNPHFSNFGSNVREYKDKLNSKIRKLKTSANGTGALSRMLKKQQGTVMERKLSSSDYIESNLDEMKYQTTDNSQKRRQSAPCGEILAHMMNKELTAATTCYEIENRCQFADKPFDQSISLNQVKDSIEQSDLTLKFYQENKQVEISDVDLNKGNSGITYHNKLIDFIKQNRFTTPNCPIKRNKDSAPIKCAQTLYDEAYASHLTKKSYQIFTENKIFDYKLNGMFKVGKMLGKGSYAEVRLATRLSDNKLVAVKSFINASPNTQQISRVCQNEVRVLRSVSHPNIIKLLDIVVSTDYTHLILEYCEGMNMYELMHNRRGKGISENYARRIFIQLLDAVHYLHSQNIYHRDLKLDNIMIDRSGKVTLIDFGFAVQATKDTKIGSFCGTPYYMAPEIYQMIRYNGPSVDIWALNVILYKITVGEFPFTKTETDSTPKTSVIEVKYRQPVELSHDLVQIFSSTFQKDPEKRISISELWQFSWLYCDV